MTRTEKIAWIVIALVVVYMIWQIAVRPLWNNSEVNGQACAHVHAYVRAGQLRP